MNLEPIEVNASEILNRIYRLRVDAWLASGINPVGSCSSEWEDEYESHARHWAVFDGERLLAAARLSIHQSLSEVPSSYVFDRLKFEAVPPIGSINRLVVHPDARGKGLSGKLDCVRVQTAARAGCSVVMAYCLEERIKPLEKLRFVSISPINFRIEHPFGPITALTLSLSKAREFSSPLVEVV